MKNKIPVVIVLYNRPIHTLKLFQSILDTKKFNNFSFFAYCDGPRNSSDQANIDAIKKILKNFKSKLNLKYFFRKKNIGLIKNITKSINSVLKKYDSIIVLEDDLILNKNFFIFMQKAMRKFSKSKKIFQISGYSYPVNNNKNHYFLSLSSCWGWGITKKNWYNFLKFFNDKELLFDSYKKINQSKILRQSFNYNNTYDYFSMLKNFFNRKVNSWGIIFYLYLFINKKLTVFPSSSLVKNNGFDGSGNHKSKNNLFNNKFKNINLDNFPNKIVERSIHRLKIEDFFKNKLSLYAKIKNKIYEKIT